MIAVILAQFLFCNGIYALIESESHTIGIDAVLAKVAVEPDFNINAQKDNSTQILHLDEDGDTFPMFETGTGINLVQYLQEKIYENEVEAFKQDKSLIDAAIVEYHKYLELTKNWVNEDADNKFLYIPSKLIDFIWHWHILQTYEYHLMCNQQFNGKFLHHRPYFGKEKESDIFKFRINKYQKTLTDYYQYFGQYPPENIWGKYHYHMADCNEMHVCDSNMADCNEMHACDSNMADCDEMHACDSNMVADCDEMHACDSNMADCDEMHVCDSNMI